MKFHAEDRVNKHRSGFVTLLCRFCFLELLQFCCLHSEYDKDTGAQLQMHLILCIHERKQVDRNSVKRVNEVQLLLSGTL